jgi:uncharacterized delta-60 repeat protein
MKKLLLATIAGIGLVACGGTGTPGFTIGLSQNAITVAQGKDVSVTVNATRSGGFNDPIAVTVTPAQAGLIPQSFVIPAGGSSGTLILNATVALPQTTSPLSLTVTAKGGSLPDQTADLKLNVQGASGSADTTFGNGGVISMAFGAGEPVRAAKVQPDGKIVTVSNSSGKMKVSRFKADGTPDISFNTTGEIIVDFGVSFNTVGFIAFQPDGKIIAGGQVQGAPNYDIGLARLNTDGTLDNSFDTDGKQTLDFATHDDRPGRVIVSGGKILVVVYDSAVSDFNMARFTSSGALDTSFDTDGKLTIDMGGIDWGIAIGVQSDGKIVIAGSSVTGTSPNRMYAVAAARVDDAGVLDPGFGVAGKKSVTVTSQTATFNPSNSVSDLKILSNGKILITGDATDPVSRTQKFAVVQLLGIGQEDIGFGSNGVALVGGPSGDYGATPLLLPDGRITLVGASQNVNVQYGSQLYMVRLTAVGALDTSFGNSGRVYVYPSTSYDIYDPTLLSDGKIQILSPNYQYTTNKFSVNLTRYWP